MSRPVQDRPNAADRQVVGTESLRSFHACTIVARNYVAHARVVAESFLEHHPGGRFTVLVLDDLAEEVGPAEPFDVIRPEEIIEEREFHRMAMLYSVLELSTAVKPWLLQILLDRGSPEVAYVDPDIWFFAPIEDLFELARRDSVVLTPHVTMPIPNDGRGISEQTILLSGAFNLGFIAVSDDADSFLDWWKERLARECRLAPSEGRFVDQRYIDLVPSLFPHAIVRDPTVNVAYWNLHSRRLELVDGRYEVEGRRLRFFHFSGFDPERPWLLSKHQGALPRILLGDEPAVRRLCREYADALLTHGFAEASRIPYRYERLPNGIEINDLMRRLYRRALADEIHEEPPDPFDRRAPDAFTDWLNEPTGGLSVSRYLLELWNDRPDLQDAFPYLAGPDGPRYLEALLRSDERIPPDLMPSPVAANQPPVIPSADRLQPGVNVVGYLEAELGIGEAARQLVNALRTTSVDCSTIVYRETPSRQAHQVRDDGLSAARYDTNLLCINADQLERFADFVGPSFFDGRYTIGVWWWETSVFPRSLHRAFDFVDEIWVGSDFVRAAIAPHTEKPVVRLPLPIAKPRTSGRTRAELGLPDGFIFLFAFDFFSVVERKNPAAVIRAFRKAFPAPGEAHLVIKSINGDRNVGELERLRFEAEDRPDIHLVDTYLSSGDKVALLEACDCFVSLHRSEGYGLLLAEAMWLEKPVIATSYGGNLDFMDSENSYLVPYRLVPIGNDAAPYPPDATWADPEIEDAARLMRHIYECQDEARAVGARAQRSIQESHSPAKAAARIEYRLAEIQELRGRATAAAATTTDGGAAATESPPAPQAAEPPGDALRQATAWLEHGPANPWDAPSPLGLPGRVARRLVHRLLRPYETRRREFDVGLTRAIEESDRRIAANETMLQALAARNASVERELERRISLVERWLQFSTASLKARDAAGGEAIDGLRHVQAVLRRSFAALTEQMNELIDREDTVERQLGVLSGRLHAPPYVADPSQLLRKGPDGSSIIGYRDSGVAEGLPEDETYLAFENVFRGHEGLIRERQRTYLPLLMSKEPVLDIGCGRGELLGLLRENRIEAYGVDIDAGMVRHCRAQGLSVEQGDGIAYLSRLPDASVGAVFSAQLIEHLEFDALVRLFRLAQEKLKPDGVFVAETVNPHAVHAFKTFWVDPTHRVPIFPETAAALARFAGFASAAVYFPNGTGRFEQDVHEAGEYALVARKDGEADFVSLPLSAGDRSTEDSTSS